MFKFIQRRLKAQRKRKKMDKLAETLFEEMKSVNPFQPIRSLEEANILVPRIEDELHRFLTAVDGAYVYLMYSAMTFVRF